MIVVDVLDRVQVEKFCWLVVGVIKLTLVLRKHFRDMKTVRNAALGLSLLGWVMKVLIFCQRESDPEVMKHFLVRLVSIFTSTVFIFINHDRIIQSRVTQSSDIQVMIQTMWYIKFRWGIESWEA